MKLKRAKAYRKAMQYLQLNFKFREPYQVLVDEEIILEATKSKYDLKGGLERTLQGEVKILITQCTMEHLYRTKSEAAINLAKTFERRRCGHMPKDDQTLSAFECIVQVVDINGKNKHRYVVATQKPKLRERFRRIPAIPLIYLARSVMVMEPLSPVTLALRESIEKAKLTEGLNALPEAVRGVVRASPREDAPEGEGAPAGPSKKRKRTREPNPLSVKKKAEPQKKSENGAGHKRRKRGKSATATGNAAAGSAGSAGSPGSPGSPGSS